MVDYRKFLLSKISIILDFLCRFLVIYEDIESYRTSYLNYDSILRQSIPQKDKEEEQKEETKNYDQLNMCETKD
jgi:hypothetical protein